MTSVGNIRWIRSWPPDGPPQFRLGRSNGRLVAEWVGLGILFAHPNGSDVEFQMQPGEQPQHVRAHLEQHVAALLRHLRGDISLHASTVAARGIAIAFVGESGAGKSTLAAQLCRNSAVCLVADDTTELHCSGSVIGVACVDSCLWLRADAATAMGLGPSLDSKTPLPVSAASGPLRLGAVVRLTLVDDSSATAVSRVRGDDAFSLLSLAMFRFALDVPGVLGKEFQNVATIADCVPIYEYRRYREGVLGPDPAPSIVELTQGIWQTEIEA